MYSAQSLREFIHERLAAAAEEIFTQFEKNIVRYDEEINRQRRLLEICWQPHINLHRIDVRKDEKVLTDQQLYSQERTSCLDQVEPEPLQEGPEAPKLKVEQDDPEHLQILEEELCISQDEEQFVLKLENVTSLATAADEQSDHDEPESNSDQLLYWFPEAEIQNQEGRTHNFSESSLKAFPELPQHHVWEKEEVLSDQQLCSLETTFSLDQTEPDSMLTNEEQQEHCISQQEGQLILEQENVTSPSEESNCHEPEPNGNQPVCQISPGAENQDQEGRRNESSESNSNKKRTQNKTCKQNEDHINSVDSPKLKRKTQSGTGLFPCKVCGMSFPQGTKLTLHMRTHKSEKSSPCETCGKCFHNLAVHMRTHTGEKPFPCTICKKTFSHRGDLIIHMRSHTGEKPYRCETCGKCFSKSSNLTIHMRTHTGEKPYSCKLCRQRYPRSSQLTLHMRSHTVEKPYCCETCGRCFSQSGRLITHMRTHTVEKPYSCEACGKGFSRISILAVHMRTHTGEKPFTCETCGKGFSRSTQLADHVRTHTGEKPYPCETCGKYFSQRSNLATHMKTQHT
ncbi:zinc finger protein 239 isoform X1 [Nothobranchius furzeri]